MAVCLVITSYGDNEQKPKTSRGVFRQKIETAEVEKKNKKLQEPHFIHTHIHSTKASKFSRVTPLSGNSSLPFLFRLVAWTVLLKSPDLSVHQSRIRRPCLRRLYPMMSIKNVGNCVGQLLSAHGHRTLGADSDRWQLSLTLMYADTNLRTLNGSMKALTPLKRIRIMQPTKP